MINSDFKAEEFQPQFAHKDEGNRLYAFKVQVRQELLELELEPDNKPLSKTDWLRSLEDVSVDLAFFSHSALSAECIISIAKNHDNEIVGILKRSYDPSNPEVITADLVGVKSEYRKSGLRKSLTARALLYVKENLPLIEYDRTVISTINTAHRLIQEKMKYNVDRTTTSLK